MISNNNDTKKNKKIIKNDVNKLKAYETFESMNLNKNLLAGIRECGFKTPSPIQQKAIMPIIDDEDVTIQAKSGSGKTATFAIGVLQMLELEKMGSRNKPQTQALIINHTRELSTQVAVVFTTLSQRMNVRGTLCVGGDDAKDVIPKLNQGQHIIFGTPGRILEMIKKGFIEIKYLKMLVLDEADEMLKEGFQEQIYNIYKQIPHGLQIIIVSATLPKSCLALTENLQDDPVRILVKEAKLSVSSIDQFYVNAKLEEYKFGILIDLISINRIHQSIIFVNTRDKVEWLAKHLKDEHFTVSHIHGQKNQEERENLMQQFRTGDTKFLITTDLYARGIDVPTVNIVINYDVPQNRVNKGTVDKETYLHRIGRCGRFRRKGVAISFLIDRQLDQMKKFAEKYEFDLKEAPKKLNVVMKNLKK